MSDDAPDTHDAPGHGQPAGVDDPAAGTYGDEPPTAVLHPDGGDGAERVDSVDACDTCDATGVPGVVESRHGEVHVECVACHAGRRLAHAGLLTRRQGTVYGHRELLDASRSLTADRLGISANVVDKHLAAARGKIEQARATVDLLDRIDLVRMGPDADDDPDDEPDDHVPVWERNVHDDDDE